VGDSVSYTFNIGVPNLDTFGYIGLLFYSDNAGLITKGKTLVVKYISDSMTVSPSIQNISCNGNQDGEINLNVSGGSGNFTYSWDNGSSSSIISNVDKGNYIVTISDTNGCTYTKYFEITEPDSLIILTSSEPSILNGSDGKAIVSTSGGTPPYTYLWNDSLAQTTDTASFLAPGTYTCTIMDSNLCQLTVQVQVDPYTGIQDILAENIKLFPNPSDGYIYLEIELPKSDKVQINIFNSLGQNVYNNSYGLSNKFNEKLDLKHLEYGIYTLAIKVKEHVTFKKISLIKN
jgi:hypothetical protein